MSPSKLIEFEMACIPIVFDLQKWLLAFYNILPIENMKRTYEKTNPNAIRSDIYFPLRLISRNSDLSTYPVFHKNVYKDWT